MIGPREVEMGDEDDDLAEPLAPRHARRDQGSFRHSGFFQGGPGAPPEPAPQVETNPLLRAAQWSTPDYRSVRRVTGRGDRPGRRAAWFALAAVVVLALLAGGGYAVLVLRS